MKISCCLGSKHLGCAFFDANSLFNGMVHVRIKSFIFLLKISINYNWHQANNLYVHREYFEIKYLIFCARKMFFKFIYNTDFNYMYEF